MKKLNIIILLLIAGVQAMEITLPIKPRVFPFWAGDNIFTVQVPNSFGMDNGSQIRVVTIGEKKLKYDRFPKREFDAGFTHSAGQWKSHYYLIQKKTVYVLDWEKKKNLISYPKIRKVMDCEYGPSKIVDPEKKWILSVYDPYFDPDGNYRAINCLIIEDLENQKVIKSVPIRNASIPDAFLSPGFVIFRHNCSSPWIAMDNGLNQVTHPLVELLNNNSGFFYYEQGATLTDIGFSDKTKTAVIMAHDSLTKVRHLFTAKWGEKEWVGPAPFTKEIEPSTINMSPSGKWAFFASRNKEHNSNYLIYLDSGLPAGCLPPFYLGIDASLVKVTWVTEPEGLVMCTDGRMFYWDLSEMKVDKFVDSYNGKE